MKKPSIVSLAVGSAFTAAALTPIAHAAGNPFAATQLQSGYLLAEADMKSADKKAEKALRQMTLELQHPAPEQLLGFGKTLLVDLQNQGIILGTMP